LHLVQEGLALHGIDPRTRERLLDSGVALASAVSELNLARHYAAESAALTEQRAGPDDMVTLRDISISLTTPGDVTHDLGDPTTAHTHHCESLDLRRRLADQLGTIQSLRDLHSGLTKLATTVAARAPTPMPCPNRWLGVHSRVSRGVTQLRVWGARGCR